MQAHGPPMNYLSAKDEIFLATAECWLAERGEVAMLIYYSHAAGSKSFEFFQSAPFLLERLQQLRPRTLVTLYKQQQLPLRGHVDEAFMEAAHAQLPPAAEYLIAGLDPVTYGGQSWLRFDAGEGHGELRDALNGFVGERVAVGAYPALDDEDGQRLSAIVPAGDGAVIVGVY